MSAPLPGVAARLAAASILGRVLRGGAYTNVVARSETEGLAARDAALGRRLAYGTLRQLLRIERALRAYIERPISSVESDVLDVLKVGSFELLFGAAPGYAAVDVAVEAARARAGERVVPFVNGVLRSVARRGEPALPAGADGAALRLGQPRWIYERVVADLGLAAADSFFEASQRAAPRWARQRPGAALSEDATPHPEIADVYELAPGTDGGTGLVVQDPASVAVVHATEARPALRVLDAAAAPGGKTLALSDVLDGSGLLVAADVHERRVSRGRRRLASLGVKASWVVADSAKPPFRGTSFDRVLVDAPCSGLGTLRRRPEIRYRLTPADVTRLATLQRNLLDAALTLVKPNGFVLYAVCTVLAEETVDVVGVHQAAAPPGCPGLPWGRGVLLGPHLTASDGMFISKVLPGYQGRTR